MKTIGHRKIRPINNVATAASLLEGARFNDALHNLPTGNTTYFPKGIYRYSSHEEANNHWDKSIIKGIAES